MTTARSARLLLVAFALFSCGTASRGPDAALPGEPSDPVAATPVTEVGRGVYVTDAAAAATDPARADALLALVATEQFDHVTLYGLAPLLDTSQGAEQLARLLRRLRAAGVRSVAAPVASAERIAALLALVQRVPEARFDALVTEHEYWNHCPRGAAIAAPAEVRPCFAPFAALVDAMRAAALREGAAGRPLRLGAYLGHPTRAEVQWLATRLDFVLLDYPVRTPGEAHEAVHPRGGPLKRRLAWCAQAGLEVWPIFYARGEVPMEPWLDEHSLPDAEEVFDEQLDVDPALAPVRARLGGFQYFADDALETRPPRHHPESHGEGSGKKH